MNKILALCSNLEKRGIETPSVCYLCHQEAECEEHLFRDCQLVSRVWIASWLGVQAQGAIYIPLKEWILNFVNKFWKEDGRESERGVWLCAILWAIWIHRNNVVFRKEEPNPYEIPRNAEELVAQEKMRLENGKANRISISRSVEEDKVSKFTFGSCGCRVCEISVDGAWKKFKWANGSRAGIGWTGRVNSVIIFKGCAMVKENSAVQHEGLAILRALEEAHAHREKKVKILTDSEVLVQALSKGTTPFQIASICQDIYEACKFFNYCEIKVDRKIVRDSHDLAIRARQGLVI
ncbi:uncharacterized protein LOC104886926 [Beta vulgaris subsp. vulgaris]|uniref:uncharacterized protein LOC104886926 n=1 Tax=Beta vulgaris subsp. vulgaris TaxID=3555 RepID=UPI0020367742|nr:uncharacterized protein LOC104886926 [Beta vulgaris subsp. vulgaris]